MRELTALIQGKYKPRSEAMFRIACASVSTLTVAGTPVDEGDLRASWTPNNGDPITRNVKGGSSANNITSVVNTLKVGDTYSFANGQPYAPRIEYESWSDQAPSGMRDVAVAQWGSIVARAVRDAI